MVIKNPKPIGWHCVSFGKVMSMYEDFTQDKDSLPVVVLMGEYQMIIDGHHRFAAATFGNHSIEVRAISVGEFARIISEHFGGILPQIPLDIIPYIKTEETNLPAQNEASQKTSGR
jgi:hypothetical protein